MLSRESDTNSPVWARVLCYSVIALSFASHATTLDRYPAPYWDEAFYYSPAINYVEGRGLKADVAADAPHPEISWAFHAPFFPRLEVVAFYLLGTSQFSSRILPYAAAHVGIALLCQCLLGAGLYRTALFLVTAWLGDCSMAWIAWARMEGACFCCLAGGYASVVRSIRTGSFSSSFLAGLFLFGAVGFHPVTILFPVATGLVILLRRKRQDILAYLCGAFTVGMLWLMCWWPNVVASVEQLHWHLRRTQGESRTSAWVHALSRMEWSRYWLICLIVLTIVTAAVLLLRLRKERGKQGGDIAYNVGAWAVLFSGCALATFLIVAGSKFLPYYFLYFTMWPVIGVGALWEQGYFTCVSRTWKAVSIGLLVCAWLPSAAWNTRRAIVPILDFGKLDRTDWEKALASIIPKHSRVTGSTEYFILTRRCDFTFIPIPFYSDAPLPAENWILLDGYDYREGRRIDHKALEGRKIAARGEVCPLARGADRLEFVLLRPLTPSDGTGGGGR
jgi:hypothetical protein